MESERIEFFLSEIASSLNQIVALLEKKWELSVECDMKWNDGTKSWIAHTKDEVEKMFGE